MGKMEHRLMHKTPSPPEPPEQERYALYGEMAAGGMSKVYYGRLMGPHGFGRIVAIKRVSRELAGDATATARFVEEGRLAARIRHPNVVQTLDIFEREGEVFLVMDYVHGETLAKLLRASGTDKPIPDGVVAAIICGTLHGLHAAHEATREDGAPLHLVHHDVTPQNVLVGVDGIPRLLDFGIATASDQVQRSTKKGRFKGKLVYAAPEQLEGASSRRSDIYSASVMLWEMLTRRNLFRGESPASIVNLIRSGVIERPSRFCDVSPELDAVVMRGLARSPVDRYATALEMALDLERCLELASPTRVSRYVQSLASETLAQRAERIAEIECPANSSDRSGSGVRRPPVRIRPVPDLPREGSAAVTPDGTIDLDAEAMTQLTLPVHSSQWIGDYWKRALLLAIPLVIVGVTEILFAVRVIPPMRRAPELPLPQLSSMASTVGRPTVEHQLSAAPSPVRDERQPSPLASVAPIVDVDEPSPQPSEVAGAAAASSVSSSSAAATPSQVKSGKPVSAAPAAPRPASDCSPPYVVDERGRTRWRLECLR
jgi:serine/threonine-protein kinase